MGFYRSAVNDKSCFFKLREEFNHDSDPIKFLYLVARCVKNAIRFNANGEFNQSADNRRLGMNPNKVASAVALASSLLEHISVTKSGDFMDVLADATTDDIVYMDPPWQGTSNKSNPRYAYLLELDALVAGLEDLNRRDIPFLLSFDGSCGDKQYGKALPESLNLQKFALNAGKSSQAILLGRNDVTIESLYLSPALIEKNHAMTQPQQIKLAS